MLLFPSGARVPPSHPQVWGLCPLQDVRVTKFCGAEPRGLAVGGQDPPTRDVEASSVGLRAESALLQKPGLRRDKLGGDLPAATEVVSRTSDAAKARERSGPILAQKPKPTP